MALACYYGHLWDTTGKINFKTHLLYIDELNRVKENLSNIKF